MPITKPTSETFRETRQKIGLKPGINARFKEMLRKKVAAMSPAERIVHVIFDEMSLRAYICLIIREDLVSGFVDLGTWARRGRRPALAEEVLVAMIRGI